MVGFSEQPPDYPRCLHFMSSGCRPISPAGFDRQVLLVGRAWAKEMADAVRWIKHIGTK